MPRKRLSVTQRIMRAAEADRGLRLTPDDVFWLSQMEIIINNAQWHDEGCPCDGEKERRSWEAAATANAEWRRQPEQVERSRKIGEQIHSRFKSKKPTTDPNG